MALARDSYLQLDDVVVTVRAVPGVGPVMTSGVVTQVRARHEGASFGSDVFLIADGVLPAQVQEIAEVRSDLADTPGRRVSIDNQQVTVADLHNLPEDGAHRRVLPTSPPASP